MSAVRPARSPAELSPSTEHYLRAILELREERGYARVVDIATRVGVTKGTVSLTLGQLGRRGLIRFDAARFPVLTAAGRRVASDVRGRYTIVQAFLTEILGLPPERAMAEACRWEHVISHEVADRLLDLARFCADSQELSRALERFRSFHRSCSAGARCTLCAVRGPVESFCPDHEPLKLSPRKPA
jgi:Mn-dependent DtxR family transcriptional regulator